MALQFIIGNSGAGKSHYAFQTIINEAIKNRNQTYFVIVPEQFTMQTQRTLVEMHPGGGILNIDILSFDRLAYRIFEEVGADSRKLLEETGKSMVLQKLVQSHQKQMPYLGSQMKKSGYINEMKSLVSEFMQYEIREEEFHNILEKTEEKSLLKMKLKDVEVLYQAYRSYLKDHYLTGEEVLEVLAGAIVLSEKIKDSVLLLDGFTGFTPIQCKVIRELLGVCKKVYVTVTMDPKEEIYAVGKPHQLFYMSRKMIYTLRSMTKEIEEPVLIFPGKFSRFSSSPALEFLEQNLFRYKKKEYMDPQKEIQVFSARNPLDEMEETARRIRMLVREKGYRYGQIAVITGNMEEYKNVAKQAFVRSDIPCFLDEKHTVLMNPFVEFLRAALEMIIQGFSYEGVFRYLRCGISDIERDETDRLENYVLALGIRGHKAWAEKWVRIYRGMRPEDIQELNQIRTRFIDEAGTLYQGFRGGKKTVREYCVCLYEFIVKCDIQKKLKEKEILFKNSGEKAMEKEYAQIYAIVMELLDKMVEILGDESVTPKEFEQLLETGLEEAKVALIPPSKDAVLIGDMERTRLKDMRTVFFVGVNEGNIPKNTESGGILTELDREFLSAEGIELAPGPKELMNIQRFYLYLNLTKPREGLCLSYCQTNGKGEPLSPAYLIAALKKLFPLLKTQQADRLPDEMDYLEIPSAGISYFLNHLESEKNGKGTPVFEELYSWYLRDSKYRDMILKLVDAAFFRKPQDIISSSVAKAIYGEVSPYGATRLERYSACAFAHFLRYGLRLLERVEYEFRAMDMGNVMHAALEKFSERLRQKGLEWKNIDGQLREALIDECLDEVAADYGNTILKSSARNSYMIQRTRRILRRTVWALQQQLKNGGFAPEGFEVSIGGGRIDRLDIMEEDQKVYIKIIDYKSGNTSFDLVALYHGLQLQLMIYLDAALKAEKKKHPDKEIEPAGVFYYNIKDPLLIQNIEEDLGNIDEKILKDLKMNGLVQADAVIAKKIDGTLSSIPVSFNKDGSFRKNASIATKEQFALLNEFVKKKIAGIQKEILEGNAEISPYLLGKKDACEFCSFQSVCGYDKKLPGYDHRRLKSFSDEELWRALAREGE